MKSEIFDPAVSSGEAEDIEPAPGNESSGLPEKAKRRCAAIQRRVRLLYPGLYPVREPPVSRTCGDGRGRKSPKQKYIGRPEEWPFRVKSVRSLRICRGYDYD